MLRTAALLALARATIAVDPTCPLVFDGRIPSTAALTDFDTNNGGDWMPFNPDYIRADAVPWSESLLLPEVETPSRFDTETVPLEVTISDESIFMEQNGFRRAGLQFLEDSNEGSPANTGQKSIHFSIRLDPERPLNRSHEYLLVWHETAAYDANQFNFEAGTVIGQEGLGGDTYKLLDRNYQVLWETPILDDAWQNFAITVDWEADTLQVYYSEGDAELEQASEAFDNDNGGEGQYQIGILKKPTGTDDVVNSGFQESGIDEGLIYGGVFIEDSADSCVSL